MDKITLAVMPERVGILLAYAASQEKAAWEYERYLSLPERQLYGVREEGALTGCIGIECLGADRLEIKHIAVVPAARGRGVGKALVKAVLQEHRPSVMVAETDLEAVGFYRGLGFEVESLGEKYPGVERFRCRYEK